ncbi:MAG: XRE family transcriptional regulator [Dehalococcoidia bacterium]|nr:XRE family transcriptional regulator [Dehalococcoidia bacterium]
MKNLRTTTELRNEALQRDPEFRAHWERTALARAIANAVIGFRIEHGLTQTGLARQLGMRQPQVARLEIGEHAPSLDTLRRLAQLLGTRLIVAISPAGLTATAGELPLPPSARVLEDLTSSDGSRLLVAAG